MGKPNTYGHVIRQDKMYLDSCVFFLLAQQKRALEAVGQVTCQRGLLQEDLVAVLDLKGTA